MTKLILASSSPRRKELLTEAGIEFIVMKSEFNEDNSEDIPFIKLVVKHAYGKAMDIANKVDDGFVLGADTIVVLNNQVIGKPKDKDDAKNILKKLSGKKHLVITAFSIVDSKTKKDISKAIISTITFKKLSLSEIDEYLTIDEYKDKAGAYAFQGVAKKFIKEVTGSESNVIGLPMEAFLAEWRKLADIKGTIKYD